jgi:hypothetical protein
MRATHVSGNCVVAMTKIGDPPKKDLNITGAALH